MDTHLEKIAFVYGDVCLRKNKQRRKRQKLLVIELLFDYAKNSTLHGLRYIAERGLSYIERFFWFATVIASVVMCSIYIHNVYQKWVTSPVIVTVNGQLSSVSSVPFPAVTICPQVKVNRTVYNYKEARNKYRNQKLFGDELYKYLNIATLCDTKLTKINISDPLTNASFVTDITEVAPKAEALFVRCKWYNKDQTNCTNLFSKVYTEEGVCFTANTLAAHEIFKDSKGSEYQLLDSNSPSVGWSPENGYNYSVIDSYPRRGRVLGSLPDMNILLVHNPQHRDNTCNVLYSGFKIFLQHPADFPQSSLYYYAAPPDQVTSLAINFHQLNTDDSLISYPAKIRQCYFPLERPLRYFKIYTAKNCQAECISNYTLNVCSCIGFYMPHDNTSIICGSNQKSCMKKAKDSIARGAMRELGSDENGCRCLPACNTIEYDAEILKSQYNMKDMLRPYARTNFFNPYYEYSQIDLFFKQPHFVTMQRRELFGLTDFLANIGGLLGVFLGFSFLSLIEIVYFLTLRVGFLLKNDLKDEKSTKVCNLAAVQTK